MGTQATNTATTRDLVIATMTALDSHTHTDDAHFEDHNKKFDKIDDKLKTIDEKMDKLNRNQIFAAGALAAIMCLMNYPQLIKALEPDSASAYAIYGDKK